MKKITQITLLVLSCLLLHTACAREGNIEEVLSEVSAESSSEASSDAAPAPILTDDGYIHFGKTYQGTGISYPKDGLIYSYPITGGSAEIICTDPSCLHRPFDTVSNPDPSCSAAVRGEFSDFNTLTTVNYKGSRILFETEGETIYPSNETSTFIMHTRIYKADPDGRNRRLLSEIDGGISSFEGMIQGDRLFCSLLAKIEFENVSVEIIDGKKTTESKSTSYYYLAEIDLNDGSIHIYEDALNTNGYWLNYLYDGEYVYAYGNKAYHRIDPSKKTCEVFDEIDHLVAAKDGLIYYKPELNSLAVYDVKEQSSHEIVCLSDCRVAPFYVVDNTIIAEYQKEQGSPINVFFFDIDGNMIKSHITDYSIIETLKYTCGYVVSTVYDFTIPADQITDIYEKLDENVLTN